jgi:predicted dehydrogenase
MEQKKQTVYRTGVIGLGVMGNIADGLGGRHPEWFKPCCHADLYDSHERTELVAGATRDSKRQALFRDKYGDKGVYANYLDMLESEELDIVSISTPATCHCEMVIAAVKAGVKAIYCEKAMAASLAECDRMISICDEAGVVLAINHQRRWDDRYRALKTLIGGGAIGSVESVQISFGGGRLCRGGSHMFDLALMFSDDEVKSGSGWLSNPDCFDPGGIGVFETSRGIRILIDGSSGMRHRFQMDIVGNQGMARILDGGFFCELWTLEEDSEFGNLVRRFTPTSHSIGNPMMNALDDILYCIEEGKQPVSSGYDGRKGFEMITGIHLSHMEGRRCIGFPIENRELVVASN